MATIVVIVGCIAASLLVFSGCAKFKNSGSLALLLLNLGFRDIFVSSMIKVIPIVEFLVGIISLSVILLNFGPLWLLFFTYGILAMFYFVFALSIMILILNSYTGDCGCFGGWFKMSATISHVLLNLLMVTALVYGCFAICGNGI